LLRDFKKEILLPIHMRGMDLLPVPVKWRVFKGNLMRVKLHPFAKAHSCSLGPHGFLLKRPKMLRFSFGQLNL